MRRGLWNEREEGHDAVHLREQSLERLTDIEIFTKAESETRIILTFDLDFGEIVALSGAQGTSVIVFRLRNTRTAHVIQRLRTVLEKSGAALASGAIIAVEESRHRVRHIPLGR